MEKVKLKKDEKAVVDWTIKINDINPRETIFIRTVRWFKRE